MGCGGPGTARSNAHTLQRVTDSRKEGGRVLARVLPEIQGPQVQKVRPTSLRSLPSFPSSLKSSSGVIGDSILPLRSLHLTSGPCRVGAERSPAFSRPDPDGPIARRRVPAVVPGLFFRSGAQSHFEECYVSSSPDVDRESTLPVRPQPRPINTASPLSTHWRTRELKRP